MIHIKTVYVWTTKPINDAVSYYITEKGKDTDGVKYFDLRSDLGRVIRVKQESCYLTKQQCIDAHRLKEFYDEHTTA